MKKMVMKRSLLFDDYCPDKHYGANAGQSEIAEVILLMFAIIMMKTILRIVMEMLMKFVNTISHFLLMIAMMMKIVLRIVIVLKAMMENEMQR